MSEDGIEAALGEQAAKHERVRALLERTGADGLLLRRASSFAWATGGVSSVINMAADAGEGALLYTPDERLLLTNSIEAPRYELETPVSERGWRVESSAWYTHPPDPAQFCSGRIVCDGPWLGADADVSGDVALLRAALLPAEQQRMHALGRDCAEIVETAMRHVRRGGTEFDLAADIARGSFARGIEPIVVLVAADERARRFRHPRPTNTAIETYAMSVLCGRRYGMVCSVSRLAHIGPVPADLARRHRAAAAVDARLLKGSVPGATLGSLFDDAIACYAEHGFADEWRDHHQGGLAGYEPREAVAAPGSTVTLAAGNACSWNPSVAGTKSEDTVIVTAAGVEIATDTGAWPRIALDDTPGGARPDILQLG